MDVIKNCSSFCLPSSVKLLKVDGKRYSGRRLKIEVKEGYVFTHVCLSVIKITQKVMNGFLEELL